jgi:hypothetical protein
MGRYYSGDIEGKFWFGVQSSDDAEFFGGFASEPQEIDYTFTEDDLPTIEQGIAACKAKLCDQRAKLAAFFEEHASYTDRQLSEHLGLPWLEDMDTGSVAILSPVKEVLEWYARLELGEKILACVKERGECAFTAEL